MSWYPLHIQLDGRKCLVVGGGPVAARKARGLLRGGATVKVVAPRISEAMRDLVASDSVELVERRYEQSDLDGITLAVTATDDPGINELVYSQGESAGVLVNSADDPENCRFILPAVIRRGPVTVTVSTGGASPAMAAILKGRLEEEIGEEWGVLTELMSEARDRLHERGHSTEGMEEKWKAAASNDVLEMIRAGDLEAARRRIADCLS
ncbi:MAG: siroheme synthase [Acidobacteria bacterium]|nr:MAG: siroheme synthase [Acidobacteriota bacterium]